MDPPIEVPEGSAQSKPPSHEPQPTSETPLSKPESSTEPGQSDRRDGGNNSNKRKKNKGRAGPGGRNKRKNLGGPETSRDGLDKRSRNTEAQAAKRRKLESGEKATPIYATEFTAEDIAAEERRPKKKVAVLLGYSGSGYYGMQLSNEEKTIEGDLFAAFVAARAISKANAADPKKSSLVRCARTDKGVHAAGNVVSLKLIIEDPDIVSKINEHLSPQIRIWGIQPTNKSFSCYAMCDSRVYEYLLPSHCLIPPHSSTFLGKKIVEYAESEGDLEGFNQRQEEVATFWDDAYKRSIQPILDDLDERTRNVVKKALSIYDESSVEDKNYEGAEKTPEATDAEKPNPTSTTDEAQPSMSPDQSKQDPQEPQDTQEPQPEPTERRLSPVTVAVKAIRAAYLSEKRSYRVPEARLARLRDALSKYIGTRNYHNYTIQKNATDPSAKRVIRSFEISPTPIIINGTEWLSLKVHGQSFMMHQIRKMVAMAVLVVRCGCDTERVADAFGKTRIAIPKAPGLGLLLERPVFNQYNKKATELEKEPIDFSKYDKEIDEFKEREIYQRIYREEEESNAFGNLFNHLDSFNGDDFLYLTSAGIPAAKMSKGGQKATLAQAESSSEDELVNNGEEGG
ncbi:tRNA pseudouridine synthase 1 [Arachnomyces sp. PD_36]|nr:tRNA pseudouridine synthase 1 [Arachnomyces sp. PD_36]